MFAPLSASWSFVEEAEKAVFGICQYLSTKEIHRKVHPIKSAALKLALDRTRRCCCSFIVVSKAVVDDIV